MRGPRSDRHPARKSAPISLFKGRWSKRHTRCHAPRAEVVRAYAQCGSPAPAGTSPVLAPPPPLWQATAVPASRAAAEAHAQKRCRSSVVEHSLGKGEVVSSILTGSTSPMFALVLVESALRLEPHLALH